MRLVQTGEEILGIFRFCIALFSAAFFLLAFGHTAWSQAKYAHTGPTIISGIRVIDGLGNAPRENQDILVSGGKGMTAMPGLIDMHIHLNGE